MCTQSEQYSSTGRKRTEAGAAFSIVIANVGNKRFVREDSTVGRERQAKTRAGAELRDLDRALQVLPLEYYTRFCSALSASQSM